MWSASARAAPRMWQANYHGTRNVLTAVQRAGVERLIHCSSVDALGLPETEEPADEDPLGEVDEPRLRGGAALEADLVADASAHRLAVLGGDAGGGEPGRHAPGLEDEDLPLHHLEERRRQAGGLARTRLGLKHEPPRPPGGVASGGEERIDGERTRHA